MGKEDYNNKEGVNQCKGNDYKMKSFLYSHHAVIELLEAGRSFVKPDYVFIQSMSWAQYFPNKTEASKYDDLIYKEAAKADFAISFDGLVEDQASPPMYVIDAGSSKTKFVVNQLGSDPEIAQTSLAELDGNHKTSFGPLHLMDDLEIENLIDTKQKLMIDGKVLLIATAGVRDHLRSIDKSDVDVEAFQEKIQRLMEEGIHCVVASGQLEAALEHNAAQTIIKQKTGGEFEIHSLSMGGQSSQYSDGTRHRSHDRMGVEDILHGCCRKDHPGDGSSQCLVLEANIDESKEVLFGAKAAVAAPAELVVAAPAEYGKSGVIQNSPLALLNMFTPSNINNWYRRLVGWD